jgi:hypothetical protein
MMRTASAAVIPGRPAGAHRRGRTGTTAGTSFMIVTRPAQVPAAASTPCGDHRQPPAAKCSNTPPSRRPGPRRWPGADARRARTSLEMVQGGVVDFRRQDPRGFGRGPIAEVASVGVGAGD